MKKFYSILLAAVSLLFSANLWALDAAWLQNQFNAGGNITLEDDVTLANAVNIYAGQTITLNLNGHTITGAFGGTLIMLYHGNLDIIGSGLIENSGASNGKGQCIQVEGQGDPDVANWSVLTIGKDVTLRANGSQGKALVVDGTLKDQYYTYVDKTTWANMTTTYEIPEGKTYNQDKNGVTQYTRVIINRGVQVPGQVYTKSGTKYSEANNIQSTLTYGYANRFAGYLDNTTTIYTKEGEVYTAATKADYYKYKTNGDFALAYGVKITVNGTIYGTEYGIKINGNVRLLEGAGYSVANIPTVTIAKGADVSSAPTRNESTAVYSSGYGKFIINGYVHGATGVYVKSGKVELNNAVVVSEKTDSYVDPDGKRSGIDAGGSAVVVESNTAFCGGQEVTVSGDTKIQGGAGYAIEEAITTASNSYVEAVTIAGGTVVAGTQGSAIITKDGADKVTVVGGNFGEGLYINDGGTVTKEDDDYFVPTTGYITTTITDEDGKKITVVTEGTEPEGEASIKDAVTAEKFSVNWTGTSENIDTDLTLDYLEINDNKAQVVTVKEGKTLTVGRIVMGAQAQIIVEAGARLIVDGEQGIVATNNDNLVFSAKEGKTAQFLFNPAVTSNRHPNATVEFESKSYYNSSADFRNQRFGIPTVGKLDAITSSNDIPVAFAAYVNGTWTNIGRINSTPAVDLNANLNKPFVYYQMSCNITKEAAEASRPVITMKGSLVGNESPELETSTNTYTTFANSYMANMNLKPLFDAVEAAEGIEKVIYTYRPVASNTFAWKGFNNTVVLFDARALEPMQAFYVKNNGNVANIALNYNDMVWSARNTEFEELSDNAPARRAADNRYDVMAQMSVKANGEVLDDIFMLQSDCFTADYEDGWDGEKMMNDDVNFFVMGNVRQEAFATDNLNNTYLGFSCQTAGEYTISFGRMSGNDLVLVDLVNGKRVNIVEGGEYTFLADAAESNDYRFQIVDRANMPTDVEEVEAAVKGNGVYSLTGQYMGNMSVWNTLPAGVYVVDGVKRVK